MAIIDRLYMIIINYLVFLDDDTVLVGEMKDKNTRRGSHSIVW